MILQEYAEDEDDALSTAYKLFDTTCFGTHAMAWPVIGMRGNIERFTRAELLAHVQGQYSGASAVVGVAGNIDPGAIVRQAEAAFGAMAHGDENAACATRNGRTGGSRMPRRTRSCSGGCARVRGPSRGGDGFTGARCVRADAGRGASVAVAGKVRKSSDGEFRGLVTSAADRADV